MYFTVFYFATDAPKFPDNVGELDAIFLEDIDADESVWTLALRAEPLLGKKVSGGKINFVSPPDEDGQRRVVGGIGAVVDANGVLSWRPYPTHFETITVADLERTHEEGLFEGDPHALLVDWREKGNGGIVLGWSALFDALATIAAARGTWDTVRDLQEWLRDRFSRQEDPGRASQARWLSIFLQHHQDHWVEQHADAQSLFYELSRMKRWRSDQVRRLFEIRPDEAEVLLSVLGYDYNPRTRQHDLSGDGSRLRFRKKILDLLLGHDPATWQEDLARMAEENDE